MCHITRNFPGEVRARFRKWNTEAFDSWGFFVFFYFPARSGGCYYTRCPGDMHAARRAGIDYEIKTSLDYKLIS